MCSLEIYQILFPLLKVSLTVHFVAACETKYTKQLLCEQRCLSGSEVVRHRVDRSGTV